jgi:PTH1 family peptidyl-tRNA hydrolase
MGFLVIDRMITECRITGRWIVSHASVVLTRINGSDTVLAKPLTYMNRSGIAVRGLMKKYGISFDDLIVVHDDVDLDLGTIRIKKGGGDGGHKGIRSIIDTIETPEFTRIRIGIDRPPDGMETSDYVLTPFSETDWAMVEEILEKGVSAAKTVLVQGIIPAMNVFNRRDKSDD